MNILLVNHYAGSDKMGMEFRPFYLCREWARLGYEPTIVGGSYSHLRKTQPHKLGWERDSGIDYFWLWTNRYKGNGVLRFFSMLIFIFQLIILAPYFAFRIKPFHVIASSTYPIDIFPCWLIAKLSGAKLTFEIHDLWPLSPMELGGYSKYHPFIMLMRFGEWFAYKFSDKIISIPTNTYEHVAKDKVSIEKWGHVPNGVVINNEAEDVNLPEDLAQKIDLLKSEGKFLVGYAGSLGPANHMEVILDAAATIKNNTNIFFFIVGDGSKKEYLEKYSNELALKNVIFYGSLFKKYIPALLKKMDILTLSGKKSLLYKFGISLNKTFDYMLASKPIVQAFSAPNDIVTKAKCGLTVEAENHKALAEGIEKFYQLSPDELNKIGKNGYDYAVKNHDYRILAKRFIELIDVES